MSEFSLFDCSLDRTVIWRWFLVKLNGGEGKRSIFGVWDSFFHGISKGYALDLRACGCLPYAGLYIICDMFEKLNL